jgi:hypothetical protein
MKIHNVIYLSIIMSDIISYKKKYLDEKEKNNNIVSEMMEQLSNFNNELIAHREQTEYYREKIKMISEIGHDYKIKMELALFIINILKQSVECSFMNPSITGSFTRQLLELPFALENTFSTANFADPRNRDIDIIVANNFGSGTTHSQCVTAAIDILMGIIQKNPHEKFTLLKSYNVSINKINKNDTVGKKALYNIPHCKLIFQYMSTEKHIEIDIIGWKPMSLQGWTNIDFDVNGIMLNNKGFSTQYSANFLDTIINISEKKCKSLVNCKNIYDHGYSNASTLSQLLFFVCNRMKIITNGYSIEAAENIPVIKIERENKCIITGDKPPYPLFHLECDHWISISSLIKNIQKSDFHCHICDCDIKFKWCTGVVPISAGEKYISDKIQEKVKLLFRNNVHNSETNNDISWYNNNMEKN